MLYHYPSTAKVDKIIPKNTSTTGSSASAMPITFTDIKVLVITARLRTTSWDGPTARMQRQDQDRGFRQM